ncbi:MAG: hypothetical protein CVU23_13430 [Betaproteobacteria bacterium HGW-Betaproteobacteria-17]|nr:MAG: hypothetical protein CVU23_13430 [Betaproteobacteria bacterium HGW-Betaproteobacteria-17]
MSKDEIPPYDDKYIWRIFAIATLLLVLHFVVYEITISDDVTAKSLVANVLDFSKLFIPGAGGYEFPRLPYEIPYMQVTLAFVVTFPLALILLMPTAKEYLDRELKSKKKKKKLTLEHAVFDVQLFSAIGILVVLLVLLIPPSSVYIGTAKSSFFGILAPIKYALCSYAMANFVLMFVLSFRVQWR